MLAVKLMGGGVCPDRDWKYLTNAPHQCLEELPSPLDDEVSRRALLHLSSMPEVSLHGLGSLG